MFLGNPNSGIPNFNPDYMSFVVLELGFHTQVYTATVLGKLNGITQ